MACITVDWSCVPDEELQSYSAEQIERAELLAEAAIRVLTAGQVGNCPTTVRPCTAGCAETYQTFGGAGWMTPVIRDGQWYNTCGCKPSDCACSNLTTIRLQGPVASIEEVTLNGQVLDPSFYRVDNQRELVRLGGPEWPACQDMAAPLTDEGTMGVSYVRGAKLDRLGEFVAGLLAQEFLNACVGRECRLPSYVQSMSREGVSMDFSEGMFPGGRTGIDEVDVWVASWNPYQSKGPSRVYSPESISHRETTWSQ